MSEDVSATMRVGITVILVASLIATVLNLMIMSNTLISSGQANLQSGIEAVSAQEFTPYDNKKIAGTQVITALDLFNSRDVAIVIQTKAIAELFGEDAALNYFGLVTKDGKSSTNTNTPDHYELGKSVPGDWSSVVTTQSTECYYVTFGDDVSSKAIYRKEGESNYTATLHMSDGLVDYNFNIRNTQENGNPGYVRDSARFTSTLIKDSNGETIGIFFKQIQ